VETPYNLSYSSSKWNQKFNILLTHTHTHLLQHDFIEVILECGNESARHRLIYYFSIPNLHIRIAKKGMQIGSFGQKISALHRQYVNALWAFSSLSLNSVIDVIHVKINTFYTDPWRTNKPIYICQCQLLAVVLCDTQGTSIFIVDTYTTIPVSPRSRYNAVYRRITKYRETTQVSCVSSRVGYSLYRIL